MRTCPACNHKEPSLADRLKARGFKSPPVSALAAGFTIPQGYLDAEKDREIDRLRDENERLKSKWVEYACGHRAEDWVLRENCPVCDAIVADTLMSQVEKLEADRDRLRELLLEGIDNVEDFVGADEGFDLADWLKKARAHMETE